VLLSPPPEQPLAKINLSLAEFEAWVPLLSLPFFRDGTRERAGHNSLSVCRSGPHCGLARALRGAGRRGTPKVGLVFQANPQNGSSADRSLSISDRAPLLRIAEIDPVSLQGGTAGRQLAAEHPGIIDATNPEIPLDEFAAAVAATDLVITVDTMAAHCAGAIGHPVGSWCPIHRTGVGGSDEIRRLGIRLRSCFASVFDRTGRMSSRE
jgi:hypothetical protein